MRLGKCTRTLPLFDLLTYCLLRPKTEKLKTFFILLGNILLSIVKSSYKLLFYFETIYVPFILSCHFYPIAKINYKSCLSYGESLFLPNCSFQITCDSEANTTADYKNKYFIVVKSLAKYNL